MASRAEILKAAESWIGTPYQHQASVKGVGCDCLGLIRGVWRDVYGEEPEAVPAYSPGWAEAARSETLALAAGRHLTEISCAEFKPGDVLLFRWRDSLAAKHAGIAAEGGFMIHAQDGARVCAVDLTRFWLSRLAYAFRFPDL
jgi:NlpC/P60 family putative phage cell wall peptidase